MTAVLVAAVATVAALWCAMPGWSLVRTRLDPWRWPRWSRRRGALAGLLVVVLLSQILSVPFVILGLGGLVVVRTVATQVLRHRQRRAREGVRAHTLELAEALASDLRAGSDPVSALARLAPEFPAIRPVHDAALSHADVSHAWRGLAGESGHEVFRGVGTAWAVAGRSGAPLAVVLDHVISDARRERDIDREIEAAVAPARSTALLMAVLPVFALSLGSTLGGSPIDTITGTLAGAVSVSVGVAVAAAGVSWVDRIVTRAETR